MTFPQTVCGGSLRSWNAICLEMKSRDASRAAVMMFDNNDPSVSASKNNTLKLTDFNVDHCPI